MFEEPELQQSIVEIKENKSIEEPTTTEKKGFFKKVGNLFKKKDKR
ncbi:MAG: hypothetical protein LIO65_03645 [Odoribacter sp.]|nr:hypothetical protein [Odoribacter sp.]